MNRIYYTVFIVFISTALHAFADQGVVAAGDEAGFFNLLDLDKPELAEVKEAVADKDWQAAKAAWGEHLETIMAQRWVWSHRDRDRMLTFLTKHDPEFENVAQQADRALRREFSAQGKTRTLTQDMQWQSKDWGYEWGNVLNRHKYWKDMGKAWWLTGDSKYAKDWAFMVRDWIKDNPVEKVRRGPWRSLETGIRVSIWLDALNLFMDAPECDSSLRYELTKSLVEHGRYLYSNNGRFRKGNWQTCECSALAYLGIVFSEFKESAQWRGRAFDIMTRHMEEGVYPDGAHYELTPGYHYWVLREFLELIILAEKNGYELPGLRERHEKMFEFLMHVSTPGQRNMSLGDAGGGRAIAESMARGALVYNRPDMRWLGLDNPPAGWIWLFPIEKVESYVNLKSSEPTLRSHMMPYAKYGVMRTGWQKEDRWLLFDCAPFGGAHSHQDQLQILIYSGRDLLVDSGQIVYDNPLSKSYFKTDRAHNVLLLNGKGPARNHKSNPQVLSWSIGERVEFASGEVPLNGGMHQRSVLFVKPDYWVVADHVQQGGTPELTRLFHLPDVKVEQDDRSVRTAFEDGDNLWITAADSARLEMREGLLPGGKSGKKAPVAAFVSTQALPAALCTVLVPFAKEDDIPKVERLDASNSEEIRLKLSFEDGRVDRIALAPRETQLVIDEHQGEGVALCVRTNAEETTVDVIKNAPLAE